MKNNFLKLNNPCDQKWESMNPTDKGSYCNSCSKNVIDFTQLNQVEISEILKSEKTMCARLTKTQLNSPLLNFDNSFELSIPTSKVAAGLMLATSLTIGQTTHAQDQSVKTEFVQSSDSTLNSKKEKPSTEQNEPKVNDVTIFSGKVTSEDYEQPIKNAKITFVTAQKLISTYTSTNGTFSIEIPADIIDDDNVIRVSYSDIADSEDDNMFFGYETQDYILSKGELTSEYSIVAAPVELLLGEIATISQKRKPIVLSNGVEIKYREFVKARMGSESSCSVENKDILYFSSTFAIAIYGEKAKDGLYILIEGLKN